MLSMWATDTVTEPGMKTEVLDLDPFSKNRKSARIDVEAFFIKVCNICTILVSFYPALSVFNKLAKYSTVTFSP